VGEPIETKGMTVRQTDELNAKLRAAIEGLLGMGHAPADNAMEENALTVGK
jgi:hypothetical protein